MNWEDEQMARGIIDALMPTLLMLHYNLCYHLFLSVVFEYRYTTRIANISYYYNNRSWPLLLV